MAVQLPKSQLEKKGEDENGVTLVMCSNNEKKKYHYLIWF